ncbi:protein-glutamate methylesterase/protein-glutamine glutaminase [Candidatus Enterovibrio altilux]|uniref:Protein-glutamate methylesterase/protein-glutamine glutaminase n=1 Tax=Candidatus Enterovibrio altilux TaxID=1927128 RepID=A0A291B846_9GAMM|nr:chemotaxis response regulator protein-glutamate methylesterase [Candidatus Enterovibrio luxaltus]ATF09184.1 Chemotaxis response regulator protein-glutamate methylesterase CheB [Candidatus Enterovibrio luxaltus]
MIMTVLVADDSNFFRRRVSEIINSDSRLKVIGCAANGKEAVEKATQLKPDVIIMDIEMPVMDGITAVRKIMKFNPTPILMFSSLTHDGAKATLDALDAGALDFLPKRFEDIARNRDEAIGLLQQRVSEIARKKVWMRRQVLIARPSQKTAAASTRHSLTRAFAGSSDTATIASAPMAKPVTSASQFKASGKRYQLVAIGTSTGGPVALQKVLCVLPVHFPVPILLIQHMPSTFTAAFAQRLNGLCKLSIKEAQNGDALQAGTAYLAPGGMQMMLNSHFGAVSIKIIDGGDCMNYKPCIDITFGSAANAYGDKVLSMILTGMGTDGRNGARLLKQEGSTIWAQDEKSCVVYGMPRAVSKAGISSEDLPLDRISERILVEFNLV